MYRKVTKLVVCGADSEKNVKKRYKWRLYDQPRVSGRSFARQTTRGPSGVLPGGGALFSRSKNILVLSLSPAGWAAILKPIWLVKLETTSRVKRRCDAVMTWCAAHGHVQASPVSVVNHLLLKQPGECERVTIQPAVSWQGVPVIARFQDVLHSGLHARCKLM